MKEENLKKVEAEAKEKVEKQLLEFEEQQKDKVDKAEVLKLEEQVK